MTEPISKPTSVIDSEKAALNKRLESIFWGLFLIMLGSWALITVMSWLFTANTHLWPLIPGGIFALLGAAMVIGGPGLDALASIMAITGRA
jgi:hypothetical protein